MLFRGARALTTSSSWSKCVTADECLVSLGSGLTLCGRPPMGRNPCGLHLLVWTGLTYGPSMKLLMQLLAAAWRGAGISLHVLSGIVIDSKLWNGRCKLSGRWLRWRLRTKVT